MQTRRCTLLLVLAVTASSIEAFAQKLELGLFGGGSFYSRPSFSTPPGRVEYDLVDGGMFGIRARENITEHFGLEQSYTITGTHNAVFPGAVVGMRLHQLYFNGNINMRSSEASVRPYISTGFGWNFFSPTDEGKAAAAPYVSSLFGSNVLDSDTVLPFNVGLGVKMRLVRHVGLDFSVRDFLHKSPTLSFPDASDRDLDQNIQVQLGLNFGFGGYGPIIVHNFTVDPAIQSSITSLCPGEATVLRIGASDSIPENQVTYRWTMGGQQVSTEPEYRFVAPDAAGPYDVRARVFYTSGTLDKAARKAVEKNPGSPVERTLTMNVKDYRAPAAAVALDRSTVQRGERVHFTSTSTGSECSGNLAYRWTTNEGQIVAAADGKSSDLDSSALTFNEAIQGQQCKPVRVSLEVRDQRGGVATDARNLQVCYTAPPPIVAAPPPPPQPTSIQVSDINFAANSTRVNNCAKRVLANELYPQLTDARYRDYDVLLVGHRDPAESESIGSQPADTTLDRERALNAAAFLSARGPTCKDIELTRVKVGWTGTEQRSDFRSNFCDASTLERRRDAVSDAADEKAKNRRVEIWLVPKGATLPAITSVQDVTSDVRRRACPR